MTNEHPSSPHGPLIELHHVSKTYRLRDGQRFDAVHPLSLRIQRGQVFGLVGQSGAGKSTLLRLINLLQNASVYDNVAFPLRVHGQRTRAEIDARVRECLALVGLQDKHDSYPARLSGGQKQRVAIARALAPRPDVLLCDEPTSALDPETTRSLLQTLKDINEQLGVTIVIVTHELPVVYALCTHVAVLEKGHLVEQFAMADVLQPRTSALGQELAEGERQRQWQAQRAATPTPSKGKPDAPSAAIAAPDAANSLTRRVAYA